MIGTFGGGEIWIRPYMAVHNALLSGVHLVVEVGLWLGLWLMFARTPSPRRSGLSRWLVGALLGLALASTTVLVHLIFSLWVRGGSLPGEDLTVEALRALVFAPGVFRALAASMLCAFLVRERPGPTARLALLLFLCDLGVCLWQWSQTGRAVIARAHPAVSDPLLLAPFVGAVLMLLLLVGRPSPAQRRDSPEP